jgi:hypothetical protein
MHYLVDTDQLEAEGHLTPGLVHTIKERSRAAMVALGVNTLLAGGITAAAGGFIFWLADTTLVAITGSLFLAIGVMILLRAGPLYRMIGNASGLIGGGMLIGGATLKLLENASTQTAAIVLFSVGAVAALGALALFGRDTAKAGFLFGSLTLMFAIMHLIGLYTGLSVIGTGAISAPAGHLYATMVLLALGYILDLRFISALAIVPFAQMLDTSTAYFSAAYVFYSPEPTLSILQMATAMVAALWLVQNRGERIGRHAGIIAIITFIVGNLCFLVGSLFGDVVGQSFLARGDWSDEASWQAYQDALAAFEQSTLVVSAGTYSVIWAMALVAMVAYAAFRNRRGMFNTALTFAAVHAYTQLFESFGDQPLAYVVGGLAAVPLAWGMWRINDHFRASFPAA